MAASVEGVDQVVNDLQVTELGTGRGAAPEEAGTDAAPEEPTTPSEPDEEPGAEAPSESL
jgi:hypothetical protein